MGRELSIHRSGNDTIKVLIGKTSAFQKEGEHRYPDWYRAAVVSANRSGVSIRQICIATGISSITARSWLSSSSPKNEKPTAFRALHVVEAPCRQDLKSLEDNVFREFVAVKFHFSGMTVEFSSTAGPKFVAEVLLQMREGANDPR